MYMAGEGSSNARTKNAMKSNKAMTTEQTKKNGRVQPNIVKSNDPILVKLTDSATDEGINQEE